MILEIVISVNCTCAIYNTTATYLNTMVCPSFNQVISGRLPRTSGPLAPQNRMVDEPSGTLVSWGVRTNQGAMPSLTESTKHRTRGQLKVHKTQNQGSAQSTQNTEAGFSSKYKTNKSKSLLYYKIHNCCKTSEPQSSVYNNGNKWCKKYKNAN